MSNCKVIAGHCNRCKKELVQDEDHYVKVGLKEDFGLDALKDPFDKNTLVSFLDLDIIYCDKCFKAFKEKIKNEDKREMFIASYRCEDGHYVRSKSEMIIDNYLYSHNIRHAYEKIVYSKIDDKSCTSDWYLPDYDVFVEYWGMNDERYNKIKELKLKIYEENNLNLLSLNEDILEKNLDDEITKYLSKK